MNTLYNFKFIDYIRIKLCKEGYMFKLSSYNSISLKIIILDFPQLVIINVIYQIVILLRNSKEKRVTSYYNLNKSTLT